MTSTEQALLVFNLFRGRRDVYARYWEKGDKHGYSPAYKFNWQEFMAHKARGGTMRNFEHKSQEPLTFEVIQDHLEDKRSIGIYPLLPDNSSHFIAADFDKKSWQDDVKRFHMTCVGNNLPAYIERSRSGKGAHVWIFFADSYPAYKSRYIILTLLQQTFNQMNFDDEVSFDRLFPNQDSLTKEGFGNLIALPLQGGSAKLSNSVFVDPDSLEPYSDQFSFLSKVEKLTTAQLDKLFEQLTSNEINPKATTSPAKHKNSLTITIDSQIHLAKAELNPELIAFLKKELNFFNMEFLIKEKMGLSTYKTEKYFKLIHDSAKEITLPRGFLNQLTQYCDTHKLKFKLNDKRILLPKVKITSTISLLPHQQKVMSEIGNRESGIIIAPPGSGKTVMGLSLVAKHQQPTLILVHRKQLLDQWVERIQSFLNVPKKEIGVISGVKRKLGKQITVAMMQTLARMENIDEFAKAIGHVIVDECHHIPAKTFREIITAFNPTYMYGLTATPERKYNDEKLIYFHIGDVLATVSKQDLNPDTILTTSNTTLYVRDTDLSIPYNAKVDGYEPLKKVISYDTHRNLQIATDVKAEIAKGKSILILTERKEHAMILSFYLHECCELICLTGDDSIATRKSKLDQIQAGNFQVLIATGQLLGEGFDLPQLDTLFLAFPFSFTGKLTQYIGRIERSEHHRVIYDYCDKQISYLTKMFLKRKTYYKKQGWIQ